MTSKGLGEMFEGDSADMCAGKFMLVLMGAERRVSRAQTRERGPPSALAELHIFSHVGYITTPLIKNHSGLLIFILNMTFFCLNTIFSPTVTECCIKKELHFLLSNKQTPL